MLNRTKNLEFPPNLERLYSKAVRYELISFLYMLSATLFSYLVMSNSQTMKTVWLEDMLGIIPPASFLIASRIIKWKANARFPYGFHKVTGISFFASSLALFVLGVYLLVDGLLVLIQQKHPEIPRVHISGFSIWLGYIMLVALLWSSLPSILLGHLKIPLAHRLYDKILFADSKMNKASWMSGFASILGVIGIAWGYWWADAGMAILISFSIIHDGFSNLKQSVLDLMDESPRTLEKDKPDPLIAKVNALLKQVDWIDSFKGRYRVVGHLFFGEIFITPKKDLVSTQEIQELNDKIESYDWRLHDISLVLRPKSHKEKKP